MKPEDVPTEMVERAARAIYEASAQTAYNDPYQFLDEGEWPEWDAEDPFFGELLSEQRTALAAVLPDHRKQVIEEAATAVERQDSRQFPGRGWDYQYAAALRNYAREDPRG